MRKIELLAPARNLEIAVAAIDHGADAVYIGARSFGARASAGNTTEDIARVVAYAHQFGVRVYVTINTLLRDDEIPEAVALAHEVFLVGVDAIISQDHRLVEAYRKTHPREYGVFHASTQMDNRDADTVRERLRQGYEQTVLARELTIAEIGRIHCDVPGMPLEVFVHGAICVCYNGRCYASEVCYGRSANRGECAQFCRMPYTLEHEGRDGMVETLGTGHYLSMRDMNRTDHLEALLDAGVTSFKIEGRLKDTAYVKNVTAWYRQHLDEIMLRRRDDYQRSSLGTEEFFFQPDITRTFNRGYTDYFMHGRSEDMCNTVTPKSMGQRVGFVKEIRRGCIVVAGTAVFHNGDGLCFVHRGKLIGFRINRAENNHLYPLRIPEELHDGCVLYRNQDEAMEHILSGRTAQRKLPVSWRLEASSPDYFRLAVTLYGAEHSLEFEYAHQPAQKDQRQGIADVLGKLGDTIYECTGVEAPGEFFIPRSILAEWRRKVLATLVKDSAEPLEREKTTRSSAPVSVTSKPLVYEEGILMTCRYCIRHHLGLCLKENPQAIKGLLCLRGADGRRFPLKFDCHKCEMQVLL